MQDKRQMSILGVDNKGHKISKDRWYSSLRLSEVAYII